MSLINKMLQDLDARGTPAADALPGQGAGQVKPVERARTRLNARVVLACIGGASAGVALAWFGWTQYQHRHGVILPKPLQMTAAAQPAAPVVPVAPLAAPVPAASAAAPAASAAPSAPVAAPPVAADPAQPAAAPAQTALPLAPDSAEARAARRARAMELVARLDALGAAPGADAARPAPQAERQKLGKLRPQEQARVMAARDAEPTEDPAVSAQVGQGRHASTPQRAESQYRKALASMQDGRMTDTIAALESTLRIDPAHEAARQTLVGLLVEAGRFDEAMRQAQVGLTLDPRQPALAMLLARLQMEHGGNGIDVLNRTLPYAGNDAEYRAFLAAALERAQRHREAAEQYGAALRIVPANGVWWMGLGLALQADKRNGEALDAFQKARAAGMPSQELQEFVERRIQQLGR